MNGRWTTSRSARKYVSPRRSSARRSGAGRGREFLSSVFKFGTSLPAPSSALTAIAGPGVSRIVWEEKLVMPTVLQRSRVLSGVLSNWNSTAAGDFRAASGGRGQLQMLS